MPTFTLRAPNEDEIAREKPLPSGETFNAEVTAIDEKVLPFKTKDGDDVTRIEFTFRILDEPHNGKIISGEVYPEFYISDRCQLRNWAQELLQAEIGDGFSLDTDMLVGKRCRILTAGRPYTNKEGNPAEYIHVGNIFRPVSDGGAPQQLPTNTTSGDLEPF